MYGRRRYSKGYSSRGTSSRTRFGTRRTYKKVGRRFVRKPRFALAGYTKDLEKKYHDKTYDSEVLYVATGYNPQNISSGTMYSCGDWNAYNFTVTTPANGLIGKNDMVKGVATGTTARSRIGNKIKPKYLKGAFTFTAAMVNEDTTKAQGGETLIEPAANQTRAYLRTTYRMVIVKDMQVNSTATDLRWADVFDSDMSTGETGGIHSELNIENMGRFIVLEDKLFTLDADTPQKTCPFMIPGSRIGQIRYNGPGANALTDKGVYIIWAAFVMGVMVVPNSHYCSGPVGHSRLCFTDD